MITRMHAKSPDMDDIYEFVTSFVQEYEPVFPGRQLSQHDPINKTMLIPKLPEAFWRWLSIQQPKEYGPSLQWCHARELPLSYFGATRLRDVLAKYIEQDLRGES